jgi:hypothetical protein
MTAELRILSGAAGSEIVDPLMKSIREVELEGSRTVWVQHGVFPTNAAELADARRHIAALRMNHRGPTFASDTRVAMFGLIQERTAVAIEVAIDSGGVGT